MTAIEKLENAAILRCYNTNNALRAATNCELSDSLEAAKHDGGAGVILVDGQSCYVEGSDVSDATIVELIGKNGFAYIAELISMLPTGEGYYIVGKYIVLSEDHKTVYRTICSATKANIESFK